MSELERFGHVPGTDAAGAYLDAANGSLLNSLYLLQVGMPGPPSLVVGVADVVSEAGPFAADCTCFGHCCITSH